jgi:hypothetical protein
MVELDLVCLAVSYVLSPLPAWRDALRGRACKQVLRSADGGVVERLASRRPVPQVVAWAAQADGDAGDAGTEGDLCRLRGPDGPSASDYQDDRGARRGCSDRPTDGYE